MLFNNIQLKIKILLIYYDYNKINSYSNEFYDDYN